MKFRVQMKNPDALSDAVEREVAESLNLLALSPNEREELVIVRRDEMFEKCLKWFRYGEYLTVEIDTDADTCVVIPQS